MWVTATVTADRLRARIEAVLAWASVRGHRSGPNPAAWRNHLDKILPKKAKVTTIKSHEAMPYEKMPAFVAALAQRPTVAARALAFAILSAARSGEVRLATWGEIDFAKAMWTVPGERMKAGKEHTVPLSKPALDLLHSLHEDKGATDLIFAGTQRGKPLTNEALLMTMRRMGESGATPHGFRSSFRTWAAERTSFPEVVFEMALAHEVGDAVVKAYRRTTLFEKRKKLMDLWATHCMSQAIEQAGDNVVSMRG